MFVSETRAWTVELIHALCALVSYCYLFAPWLLELSAPGVTCDLC